MADFDPFANQGGAAAWDPEQAGAARKQADELLKRLAAEGDEPGSGPSTFSGEEDDDGGDYAEGSADDDDPTEGSLSEDDPDFDGADSDF